jgi:hypothetical protein
MVLIERRSPAHRPEGLPFRRLVSRCRIEIRDRLQPSDQTFLRLTGEVAVSATHTLIFAYRDTPPVSTLELGCQKHLAGAQSGRPRRPGNECWMLANPLIPLDSLRP